MKKVLLLSISFVFLCQLNAQTPHKDLGIKEDEMEYLTLSDGRYDEYHGYRDFERVGSAIIDMKTRKILRFIDKDSISYEGMLDVDMTTRFLTSDPLAEKYFEMSPYGYCANNPIKYIDPNGMDIYRYDDNTGEFSLYKKTEDKFDQVGKFKYDKKTGEYTLKTNKKGEAKTRIDNVEKGILSDGVNFQNNSNVIEVGGEGQASVDGVEAFAVNLSEMVGKEIAGAYISKDGSSETTHMTIGAYKNNKLDESKEHGHSAWMRLNPNSNLKNDLTGFFHTHPTTGYSISSRTSASDQDRTSRDNALKTMPNLQFYILTYPIYYGGKFPYKIPYTN